MSLARKTLNALFLFLSCDRSSWQVTTIAVGRCVILTAESVVFTLWPPCPEERNRGVGLDGDVGEDGAIHGGDIKDRLRRVAVGADHPAGQVDDLPCRRRRLVGLVVPGAEARADLVATVDQDILNQHHVTEIEGLVEPRIGPPAPNDDAAYPMLARGWQLLMTLN